MCLKTANGLVKCALHFSLILGNLANACNVQQQSSLMVTFHSKTFKDSVSKSSI